MSAILIGLMIRLFFCWWAYTVAMQKRRSARKWAAFAFFLPILAVICVYCVKTRPIPMAAPV